MSRIQLMGCPNTRDLGGMVTEDGKKIKENKLIRSGALKRAFGNDLDIIFGQHDVKTIVDFRTESEIVRNPDPELEGVSYYKDSIFKDMADPGSVNKDMNPIQEVLERAAQIPDDAKSFMKDAYVELVKDEHCQKAYQKFFDVLLKQEDGAVLWHCSEGKDRTGMGAAFLLAALGVPLEDIKEDYLYSNVCVYDEVGMILGTIGRLVSNRVIEQKVLHMMTVSEEYWQSAMDYIETEYGDLISYLHEALEITDEDIKTLKEKYLEA